MMAKKTLRAAVYGRESKGKTKSVADQVRIGESTVVEHGWIHAGVYSDKTSASRFAAKARGGWTALRADVEAGSIDLMVLWETSRGSRTLADWVNLLDTSRSRGVLLHVVSHERTYDPRRSADYKALADAGVSAAHSSDQASEAILRGVASSAVDGKPHGRVPFGYERSVWYEGSPKVKMIEQHPHPVHSVLVRDIITRVASREPLIAILRDLNSRGVPSPTGGRWGVEALHRLVRNPAYVGLRHHRGALTDAVWPGIMSPAMWHLANLVLDEPNRRTNQPGGLRHLLSYFGTTADGGRWNFSRGRYRCYVDHCTSIVAATADELITRLIVARLCKADARELFAPDDTASVTAREELARLEAELAEARASFAIPGGISAAALAMKEGAMAAPIADARRRSRPTGAPLAVLQLLDAAEFGEEHVRPVWDGLPLPAQRGVIETLFESIVLGPPVGKISRWTDDDDRLDEAARRITITWRT